MPGLNEGAAPSAAPLPFSVVTFNVRYAGANDGVDSWDRRAPIFDAALHQLAPDILCTQEAVVQQIRAIESALPDHQRIGVGRVDGVEAGEWSAIFVRRSRFQVLEEGNFWFSDTPLVPGTRAWDAPHHPRLCTWARLRDAETPSRTFLVYNSHWDNEGVIARENSAVLIAGRLTSRPVHVPAIVTGDFNCGPESAPVRYLTVGDSLERATTESATAPSPHLRDSWIEANSGADAPSGTFHGFGGKPDGERIDYILHTEQIEVQSCEIVRWNRDGRYPSDHFPVRAVLRFA